MSLQTINDDTNLTRRQNVLASKLRIVSIFVHTSVLGQIEFCFHVTLDLANISTFVLHNGSEADQNEQQKASIVFLRTYSSGNFLYFYLQKPYFIFYYTTTTSTTTSTTIFNDTCMSARPVLDYRSVQYRLLKYFNLYNSYFFRSSCSTMTKSKNRLLLICI